MSLFFCLFEMYGGQEGGEAGRRCSFFQHVCPPSFEGLRWPATEVNMTQNMSHSDPVSISHRDPVSISHCDPLSISHCDQVSISHCDPLSISHCDCYAVCKPACKCGGVLSWTSNPWGVLYGNFFKSCPVFFMVKMTCIIGHGDPVYVCYHIERLLWDGVFFLSH